MSTVQPLTPADCDLRDFPFMHLDVRRLRDSDLAANEEPEACWAALLLWCASWHQVPAASLPDDDRVLANLAGYGRVVSAWRAVKSGALRGFVKCADGRLYHPVVAEKANNAWLEKLAQRWRTECARIKKANQRNSTELPSPTLAEFVSHVSPETARLCPEGHWPPSPGTGVTAAREQNGDSEPCPQGQENVSPQCPSGNGIQGRGRGRGIELRVVHPVVGYSHNAQTHAHAREADPPDDDEPFPIEGAA